MKLLQIPYEYYKEQKKRRILTYKDIPFSTFETEQLERFYPEDFRGVMKMLNAFKQSDLLFAEISDYKNYEATLAVLIRIIRSDKKLNIYNIYIYTTPDDNIFLRRGGVNKGNNTIWR